MPAKITVVHKWARVHNQGQPGVEVIDTTSGSDDWRRHLSPFFLGPCQLYDFHVSLTMENAWQYAKVYADHIKDGEPTAAYWKWAEEGWGDPRAHRYPMGKGAVPVYGLWENEHLGYVDARKKIYGPLYVEAVRKMGGFGHLVELRESSTEIYLRDWDGWSMERHGMENLSQVLNNPHRKMGHAFVLKMLLEDDIALSEMDLR